MQCVPLIKISVSGMAVEDLQGKILNLYIVLCDDWLDSFEPRSQCAIRGGLENPRPVASSTTCPECPF